MSIPKQLLRKTFSIFIIQLSLSIFKDNSMDVTNSLWPINDYLVCKIKLQSIVLEVN